MSKITITIIILVILKMVIPALAFDMFISLQGEFFY